jgi:integrase
VAWRKHINSAPARAFGFHTFRWTLASVLVKRKVGVKTVQEIAWHQNLKTAPELYAKSMSEDKILTQRTFSELLFSHRKPELFYGCCVCAIEPTAGK